MKYRVEKDVKNSVEKMMWDKTHFRDLQISVSTSCALIRKEKWWKVAKELGFVSEKDELDSKFKHLLSMFSTVS